jgi:hypothetical protein
LANNPLLSRQHVADCFRRADKSMEVKSFDFDAVADFETVLQPYIVPSRNWSVGITYPHVSQQPTLVFQKSLNLMRMLGDVRKLHRADVKPHRNSL